MYIRQEYLWEIPDLWLWADLWQAAAYMMQMPLFILLIGLIYLVEVLSVMIQVTYFKATHGKRIFKMAPIHHHFELCGWSETRVVAVFSVITAVMCLIALLAIVNEHKEEIIMNLQGKKVLVFGAGKSGIGAAELLGTGWCRAGHL